MRTALALLAVFGILLFSSLGIWQVKRLSWKLDLIARTEHALAAAPIPAPEASQWPTITPANTYTRITATGQFLNVSPTFVLAVTNYGRGYWTLSPFATTTGFTLFINRGFVLPEQRTGVTTPTSPTTINGLLRITEPTGAFLRTNKPSQNLWYSRDVAALSAAQNLSNTAPYFLDADASQNAPEQPVGGLTVVTFRNNHLVYALTWFGLAILSLIAAIIVLRSKR